MNITKLSTEWPPLSRLLCVTLFTLVQIPVLCTMIILVSYENKITLDKNY